MPLLKGSAGQVANKTTDKNAGEWFCFTDAQTQDQLSQAVIVPVYPDSNIKAYGGTPPFFWYLHGIGSSFDPKSDKFTTLYVNANPVYPQPSFKVTNTDAYTVDSINIVGSYFRFHDNAVPDTLFIEVARTGTPGVSNVTWSYGVPLANRADSLLEVVEPTYSPERNAMDPDSVTQAIRIVKILDAAAASDTDANGLNSWNFSVNLSVPAGQEVVAFAHFAPSQRYALNTDIDTANSWQHFSVAVNGQNADPDQNPGDWNGGLLASTDERYQVGNPYVLNNGRKVLAAAYAYTPHFLNDPWFAFKIKCPTCSYLGVKDVENFTSVNAYPNPASGTATISFNLKEAANVNITISNTLGQVLKTQSLGKVTNGSTKFDVSDLSTGVYFYTVEANGQRLTNRFVVTH